MYYQESDTLVADQFFAEEDVAAVDSYLYDNRGGAVRLARAADFTNLDILQLESLLSAYVDAGVVTQLPVAICERDDVPLAEPGPSGEYFCDLCEQTYPREQVVFETAYRPRETRFECGDRLPSAHGGTPDVAGIDRIIGCSNPNRTADVVFIHGLDGDAMSTWHPRHRPNRFWPKWIGEDIPEVGVWSLGYQASSMGWKGTSMPLLDRAVNTLSILEAAGIGQHPVIFIVHSLGGLLAKQMQRTGRDLGNPAWRQIADNIAGIFFVATPHSGSNLANYTRYLATVLRTTATVKDLEAHNPALRDLNSWFRNNCRSLGTDVEVVYETRKTHGVAVVDPTSSDPGIPGVIPIPIDADHVTICKPDSREQLVYARARRFVESVLTRLDSARGSRPGTRGETG